MKKRKLLVSSCLLGENVKYNGENNLIEEINKLSTIFEIVSICPEVLGGMTIPRLPCEIVSMNPLQINNEYGIDMKDHFIDGALQSNLIASKYNIKIALLKSNSPSCGNIQIYDGTFKNKLINGSGTTANILIQNGVKVFNENQIDELYEYIK